MRVRQRLSVRSSSRVFILLSSLLQVHSGKLHRYDTKNTTPQRKVKSALVSKMILKDKRRDRTELCPRDNTLPLQRACFREELSVEMRGTVSAPSGGNWGSLQPLTQESRIKIAFFFFFF